MKSLAILLSALAIATGACAAADRNVTLQVSNMNCATCPITVRIALEKVPGVEEAKVDFKSKLAVVSFDSAKATPDGLMRATAKAGFPSTLKQAR